MVVVNCGALPEGILESELFGHEAGAFTGARARHKGKFEAAEGGTVFLDEIGEVSPKVQVELLRVLEEKLVTRLGGTSPVSVDFRTICATNRDLQQAVRDGSFREDLFWRLNVVQIHIPPLRERPEDVAVLAEHFLARFAQSMSRRPMRFAPEAMDALAAYAWPGNVRELRNIIEQAVLIARSDRLEPDLIDSLLSTRPVSTAAFRTAPVVPIVVTRFGYSTPPSGLSEADQATKVPLPQFARGVPITSPQIADPLCNRPRRRVSHRAI
jgi:transcriptional regulator with GAF, ATPase, and Fis domain